VICRVLTERVGDVWRIRIESNVPPPHPFVDRTIDAIKPKTPAASPALPRPPAGESGRWNGKPHAALCDATDYQIADIVYRRILENNPKAGEVGLFGDYLTAVLLGPNLDILESCPPPIDLRLCLDDPALQRLPWEMMYAPPDTPGAGENAPLSARPNRRFAINREVTLAAGETRAKPAYKFPLKVLFVVGTKIDAVLRPGAEFIGLLRHLRVPVDLGFQGEFVSANVKLRFLPEGDIDRLKSECRSFQPSVLHFICHGQSDPAGGPSRIVLRIRPPGSKEGDTKPFPVTADELANHLGEDQGWVPPIVVLNACYTATTPNQAAIEDGHLPFAARLVQRGAAIAIGMTGEVADPACQMFTLRFYQALLTNTPVIEAASQARRAVLTAWPEYQQSVEWARPALFLASGLDGTVACAGSTTFDLVRAGERFRKDGASPRMMCDRYEMLVAYDRLVTLSEKQGSTKLIVAFSAEEETKGLGKTRMLEEVAVRSVLDGFLPCVFRDGPDIPSSLLDFALALSDVLNDTRKNFLIPPVDETEARRCAIGALPEAPAPEERKRTLLMIRSFLKQMGSVDQRVVLAAIREDCAQIVKDVSAVTGLPHRVLILIDEFHRWEAIYAEFLKAIDFTGLGTLSDPIPVVLNYIANGTEGQSIQVGLKSLPEAMRPQLRRFDSEVDRDLVYRQLLLSEWQRAPKQTRDAQPRVKKFFADLHQIARGVPGTFLEKNLTIWVSGALSQAESMVDADYETVLRTFGA
jgi:hypothetical protein